MVIKCPECELQVSDKAISCPHCGYPMRTDVEKKKRTCKKKHMRLPNGFGQITELKGRNLRTPYRAMITVGKTSTGRPICKPLKPKAYFETYNDAYMALVEYNRNPYDLELDVTVKELYDRWTDSYFPTLKSASSTRTITAAWAYCSSVYDMRAKDIRARHIKGCMDNGVAIVKGEERHTSPNIKSRIKSLFNLMMDYALEYEIVDRNYARTFDISTEVLDEMEESRRGHISFTDEEIKTLWDNVKRKDYVDIILIQCYSGWRPQELGLIELDNVDLNNWTFTGGMKTDAGINRTVPIHSKIRHLVKAKYNEAKSLGSDYLFNCIDARNNGNGLKLTYDKYNYRFCKVMSELKLNPEHKPHDPRKQFVTMAKKNQVDNFAIKRIVGHSIDDITEKIYTDRDIEWLKEEIEKIG